MNQENTALNFQLDQYRSTLKNASLKGLASAAVLTAGAVATYSNIVDAKALNDKAQWTADFKDDSSSIAITGNSKDGGANKYEQLQLSSEKAELNLNLRGEQKLLISDTTHKYLDNSFTAKTNKLSVTGESGAGSIDVAAENAKTGDDFGMSFISSLKDGLNVNVGSINVQSKVQVGTSGAEATANVAAKNITIGNGKVTTGTDKKTYGQAAVLVGGSGGTGGTAFDGEGSSTFGDSGASITVNDDGKLQLHSSKTDKKANSIIAANVSINGGVLSFDKIADGKGSSSYNVGNTDVADGYVAVKSGSGLTITGGDFNIRGKSHLAVGDNLTIKDAKLSVDSTSVFAAESGSTTAKLTLEGKDSEGTLKLDKSKLKEFLTGMKSDNTALQYADADEHFNNQKDTLKNAASGSVVLGLKGGIEFTDDSLELADKDLKFSDKDTAGSITVKDGGFIRGHNVSISNNVANAQNLAVEADHLKLGSTSFDSSTSKLGVKTLNAKSVEFIANQQGSNYTLQDDVVLSSNQNETIKGGIRITSGSLTIDGGKYTLEAGKDLIIANGTAKPDSSGGGSGGDAAPKPSVVKAAAAPDAAAAGPAAGAPAAADPGPDASPAKTALAIENGSLVVSGKLETSGENGIALNNGTLDARNASSYKIAASSIKLENASNLHLDGTKVLTVNEKGVEFKKDSFDEKALVTGTNGNNSTVYLDGVGSMNMEQFKDLKTKTAFEGFFEGFAVTGADSKPSMDFKDIETGTPDGVYAGTQATVSGAVDKSVSVGSMMLSGTNTLEIGAAAGGGGTPTPPPPPPQPPSPSPDTGASTSTTVKLTNAAANSNANRNFVQTSDGSLAGVTFNNADSSLQLQGAGNIGGIDGKAANDGNLFIGNNEGTAPGHVTVIGDIGGTNAVGTVNVQKGSELTVNGTKVTTQELYLARGSELTAKTATITITGGTSTGTGPAAPNPSYASIEGDLTAKELVFSGSGNHVIAGNATVAVEKLVGSAKDNIQIGQDNPGGLGATVIAQTTVLNKGTLFVDPDFNVQSSYHITNNLSGAGTDPHNAGTLDGKAVVGKNAVLAIGFDNKNDVVSIIKEKLGTHGGFIKGSGTENALIINKGIKLAAGDSITVDSTATGLSSATTTAGVKLGANAAIVITDNVYTHSNAQLQGAAIDLTAANNKKVEAADDTTILLSGKFSSADKGIQIFKGATNAPSITVMSVNGYLSGKTKADGTIDQLSFMEKQFKEKYKSTSKPVRDLMQKAITGVASTIYDDTAKAGAQFVIKSSTDSINAAELDRAVHAALFTGSQQAALNAANVMSDAMTNRAGNVRQATRSRTLIAQQPDNPLAPTAVPQTAVVSPGMWGSPNYKRSKVDGFNSDGAEYGADIDMTGFTAGADMALGDLTVGAAASFGSGDSEGNGRGESLKDKFDYYGLGVYASVALGQLSLVGDASYNLVKHDISGYSGFADFGNLSASTDSNIFSAGVTAKYVFDTPYFALTPHFGTRFTRLETDSYDLGTSKGVLAHTDVDVQNIVSIPVGVGVSQNFYNNGWIVTPNADLTVTFNQGDTDAGSTTKLSGVRKALNMNTEVFDDVTYGLKVGVGASNGNFSSHVNLNYDGSDNTNSFSINAGASYNF